MPPNFKRFKFSRMRGEDSAEEDSGMGDEAANMIINFYDPNIKGKDARHRTLDEILEWPDAYLERSHNYIQVLFPLPEGSPFNMDAPIVDRSIFDAFRSRDDLRLRLREAFVRMLKFYGFKIVGETSQDKKSGEGDGGEQSDSTTSSGGTGASKDPDSSTNIYENESSEGEQSKPQVQDSIASTHATEGQDDNQTEDSERQEPSQQQDVAPPKKADAEKEKATLTGSGKTNPADASPSSNPTTPTIVRAEHWKVSFGNWAVHFDHNHLRMTRILRSLRVLGLEIECKAFYAVLKEAFEDPRIAINQRTMQYWTKAVEQPLHIAPDGERISWLRKWEDDTSKGE